MNKKHFHVSVNGIRSLMKSRGAERVSYEAPKILAKHLEAEGARIIDNALVATNMSGRTTLRGDDIEFSLSLKK